MRFVRALPGTLGVLAIVFLPAVVAVFNLGAGLAGLRAEESRPTVEEGEEQTALVGTYDEATGNIVLNPRTRIRARAEPPTP